MIPAKQPRNHAPRRQEPRFFARIPLTLLSSPQRDQLVTWDVSFRGLFIETEQPRALRQLVRFDVLLPTTGTHVVLHGMVVNVVGADDDEGRPQGMGVELYGVDRETRGAWWGLVRFVRDHLDELDEPSGIRVRS